MSLARFYSRIANAVGPFVGSSADLASYLGNTSVSLEAPTALEDDPSHRAGFLLAVNLCARLYPRLHIHASKSVTDECGSLALQINPNCEIETKAGNCDGSIVWGKSSSAEAPVIVSPAGWSIRIDQRDSDRLVPTNILTALGAGALAVGEVFRTVFARFLPRGRVRPAPGVLNILTLNESTAALPDLPRNISLGRVHLAGAGAVGQAAVYALSQVSILGTMVVVDPESLALSNLQRYVLAFDADVGASKCALVERALRGKGLEIVPVESQWGNDDQTVRNVECVCTALDTASARIAVQAGLPRKIYNAWTQPADVGWSRHESFGEEPCLACLYVPTGRRPSQHELVSRALRQPELRVLAYLTFRVPVDSPLRPEQIPRLPNHPVPQDASTWVSQSILEDIGQRIGTDSDGLSIWKGKQIGDLYREGICGGAIISDKLGELPQEVAVPLAHQSAFAGIMLATQLIVGSSSELQPFRSSSTEARLDVLAGLPQVVARPRQRTPSCLCSDSDFVARYNQKWVLTKHL